jgi:hypothetical protein
MPLRPTYKGKAVQAFSGKAPTKRGELISRGKQQLLEDLNFFANLATEEQRRDAWELILKARPAVAVAASSTSRRSTRVAVANAIADANSQTPMNLVSTWWGIAKRTIRRIRKQSTERPSLSPLKKPGRPETWTDDSKSKVRDVINQSHGLASAKRVSAKLTDDVAWSTKYKGRTRTTPGRESVRNLMNKSTFQTMRMAAKLGPAEENERKEFAAKHKDACYYYFDLDESYYVTYSDEHKKRRLMTLPGGTPLPPESLIYHGTNVHPPQVFMFGVVTGPEFEIIEGSPVIHPRRNGKVALFRVRATQARKRKSTNKRTGVVSQRGDPKYSNATISGVTYAEILLGEGGVLDAIAAYQSDEPVPENYSTARVFCLDLDREFDVSKHSTRRTMKRSDGITIQEDGAPGHGYNNRRGSKATAIHDDIKAALEQRRVTLIKQPKHSPEMNKLDLGVWNSLKSSISARAAEILEYDYKNSEAVEAAIWKIAKDEWDKLDPIKLFNLGKAQETVFQQIEAADGKRIKTGAHAGVRVQYGTGR